MIDLSGLAVYKILPGEQRAVAGPAVLTTLLGSCVAACLYDPEARVAGINHFLLVAPRYARDMPMTHTDAGRYGINAMELLINAMIGLGARRQRIKAKVFGGGSIINPGGADKFFCVSEQNQRFIREYMKTEGMEIVSEDLGGDRGRIIRFHTDSFAVLRKYIPRSGTVEIEAEEHRLWADGVKKAASEGEVLLF